MAQKLTESLVKKLSSLLILPFGKQLIVFIISLMPILESRGGLIAASIIKLDIVQSIIIAFIGNIIPLILIIFAFDKIYIFMRKSNLIFLNKLASYIDAKIAKHKDSIEKYDFWGLALFVGIPLPGTGAWTGCIIASALQMDKKKALISSIIGVIIATAIMSIFSFGILARFIQ